MDELNCEMDGWNWQMDAMFSSICYFLVLYSTREGNVRVQMFKVIKTITPYWKQLFVGLFSMLEYNLLTSNDPFIIVKHLSYGKVHLSFIQLYYLSVHLSIHSFIHPIICHTIVTLFNTFSTQNLTLFKNMFPCTYQLYSI